MKNQLAEIAFRKEMILKEIDAQRLEVADISQHFEKPLKIFDMGQNAAQFLYRHPTILIGGFAVIMTLWRKGNYGLSAFLSPPLRFALNRIFSSPRSPDKKT
jgi:hypothetical protein